MFSNGVCARWRVHREVLPEELPKLALPYFGINVEGAPLPACSPWDTAHVRYLLVNNRHCDHL